MYVPIIEKEINEWSWLKQKAKTRGKCGVDLVLEICFGPSGMLLALLDFKD